MKKAYRKCFFGYKCAQVDDYISKMKNDYEDALSKKRDRIVEQNDSIHTLKDKVKEITDELNIYKKKEKCIANVLLEAETKAQAIEAQGKNRYMDEMDKIKEEQKKWSEKFITYQGKLIEIEKKAIETIDCFKNSIHTLEEDSMTDADVEAVEQVAASAKDDDIMPPLTIVKNEEYNKSKDDKGKIDDFDLTQCQYMKSNDNLEELCRGLGVYNSEDNND